MKIIYLTLSAMLSFIQLSHAQWITSGNNIYNSNSGYVGIGTNNPTQSLTVAGDILGAHLKSQGNVNISSNLDARIYMSNTTSGTGQNWNIISESNGALDLGIFGSNPFQTITANGNVGIGTTNPSNRLEIIGASSQTMRLTAPYAGGGTAVIFADGGAPTKYNWLAGAQFNTSNAFEITPSTVVGGAAFTTPVMTILQSGNVGIGTTTPGTYKLAVSGNVHAQQVNIDMTGWSDYVFNVGYRLTPLSEVKAYIEQNHHLPDVPSEKEIVKNGLALGEMNKLLMKKVEELTLYLIEKEKENEVQNERISRLEEMLKKSSTELTIQK